MISEKLRELLATPAEVGVQVLHDDEYSTDDDTPNATAEDGVRNDG